MQQPHCCVISAACKVQVHGLRQVLRCRYAPSPQYDMLLKYQLPGTNDMEELVSLENNEDLDNFKVSLVNRTS